MDLLDYMTMDDSELQQWTVPPPISGVPEQSMEGKDHTETDNDLSKPSVHRKGKERAYNDAIDAQIQPLDVDAPKSKFEEACNNVSEMVEKSKNISGTGESSSFPKPPVRVRKTRRDQETPSGAMSSTRSTAAGEERSKANRTVGGLRDEDSDAEAEAELVRILKRDVQDAFESDQSSDSEEE